MRRLWQFVFLLSHGWLPCRLKAQWRWFRKRYNTRYFYTLNNAWHQARKWKAL